MTPTMVDLLRVSETVTVRDTAKILVTLAWLFNTSGRANDASYALGDGLEMLAHAAELEAAGAASSVTTQGLTRGA
jgi:hypothetical protein